MEEENKRTEKVCLFFSVVRTENDATVSAENENENKAKTIKNP